MKISIVTPAYNEEQYIDKYLLSLKNLDYDRHDLEVIIVNDASTDRTRQMIEDFAKDNKDINIKIINNEKNKGVLFSRNLAVKNASNEYVVNIDAHSIIDEKLLKAFVRIHTQSREDVIMGNDLFEKDNIIGIFNQMLVRRIYGKKLIGKDFDDYSIDVDNFEGSVKGTSPLFIKKSLYLKAVPDRHGKTVSDDITLLKNVIKFRGKFTRTSKAFCIYLSRKNLIQEFKHIFHRGPKFVDYYWKRGTKFYNYLLILTVLTALSPVALGIAIWLLGVKLLLLSIGALIILSFVLSALVFAKSMKEFFVSLFFPIFLIFFILGVYRGLIHKLLHK